MSMRVFQALGLSAAAALLFWAGCHSGANTEAARHSDSQERCTGRQKDCWRVLTRHQVQITSELTLRTRPAGPALLPIRLPYTRVQLVSVKLAGRRLYAHHEGGGVYEIELPSERQATAPQPITVTALLALHELEREPGVYQVHPGGLIPVVSHELWVSADPNSGFEVATNPPEDPHLVYRWNNSQPALDFESGRCGLPIRRRL